MESTPGGSAVTAFPNAKAFGLAMVRFSTKAAEQKEEETIKADAHALWSQPWDRWLAEVLIMETLYYSRSPKKNGL
jgi:hypothetical protein